MVFIIQNTQDRDSKAMHLKLDELLRVNKKARNLLNIEEEPEKELKLLEDEFKKDAEKSIKSPAENRK